MMQPKAASKPRSTSTGSAAPPDTHRRSERTSASPGPGWLSRPTYIVGTPSKTVTRSRWITSSALPGSKRASSVRLAPAPTAALSPQVWPKEWNSGRQPITTSPGSRRSRVVAVTAALRARLAWVSSAPLGRPVVAEGDRITARAGAAPVASLGRRAGARLPGEDDPGAAVGQVVLDLARLQQRVHRDHHRPGPQHPVVQHRELRDVRQHQPDPVAGCDAAGGEPA